MKIRFKFLAAAALCIGLASCEKDLEETNDTYDDVVNSEMEQEDIAFEEKAGIYKCDAYDFKAHLPECATVTDTMTSYPKTIVIDYGEGCEGKHGRIKKGKVIINQSAPMKDEGATRTIQLEDFYVNEVAVEGTRTVTNLGLNDSGNMEFSIEGEMKGTRNGKTRSRTFTRKREWIKGMETCEREDNEFLITGSATITRGDRVIQRTITKAIHVAPGTCSYPLSGTIKIEGPKRSGTIDFGDGNCDSEAVLTNDKGKTKVVDLKNRKCHK